ncbi:hypothetical protein MD484_g2245, partial [Candolleomyces efflorescens]
MDLNTGDLIRLLKINDPPNSYQKACLMQNVEALDKEIKQLSEANAADPKLGELMEQLQQHRLLLSSSRRMPPEILSEIISNYGLPSVLDCNGRARLKQLCLVCKSWWTAAQVTHRLWSGLSLEFGDTAPLRWDLIADWFRRSGNLPRTLELKMQPHSHSRCNQPENCLLASSELPRFLAQGPVLTRLSISSTNVRCSKNLLHAVKSSQPESTPYSWDSISSMSISCPGTWYDDSSEFLSKDLPSALTTFELFLPSWPSASGIPTTRIQSSVLNRLTTLHIQCNWPRSFLLATLQECPNVETLTLDLAGSHWTCDGSTISQTASETAIQFPKLETLRLRHLLPEAAEILRPLKAPVLSSLDISFRPYEGDNSPSGEYDPESLDVCFDHPHVEDEFAEPLWTFLQQGSHPAVRYLRIHGAFLEYNVFPKLWRIQSLRHLCLDDSMYDILMQDFPNIWSIVPQPLPNLEVLEWLNFPKYTGDIVTVDAILEKRDIDFIYSPDVYGIWSG